MSNPEDKLKQLQTRIENLAKYESAFKREIADIRREINSLKTDSQNKETKQEENQQKTKTDKETPKRKQKPTEPPPPQPRFEERNHTIFDSQIKDSVPKEKSDVEKFIGKYLISIIGVLITVIGVGIGAKYAIDNNLISPLTRIIFGYAVGFGLIGFAVRLKAKYETFSSVLLSGGMAIMYFVTYFAYAYYSLLSQTSAFMLMVIFTIFTILSAIIYNRQIIAHIGLVGAYAVPFLLSEGSGRVDILFSYISIINIGVLAVSINKYWKYLFYSSFIFTWLIYAVWYLDAYEYGKHFTIALSFLSIFFLIFYATFLAYKLIHKKPFNIENVALILQNSFMFFGFGYAILQYGVWDKFLGLFALLNAFIHFIVASIIYKYKLGDKNAFYLIVVLVLTFLTIAVPIQFDGNWITILWMAEALFLFIIARIKKIALFEYFSYPLIILASISLLMGWLLAFGSTVYDIEQAIMPFFNKGFVTSIFVAIGFAILYFVDRNKDYKPQTYESIYVIFKYFIPTAFLIILYNTFRIEIGNYFSYQAIQTAIKKSPETSYYSSLYLKDLSLVFFSIIWQIKYTIFFLTVLSFLNIKKLKDSILGFINLGLNSFIIFIFLTIGLFALGELRVHYLSQINSEHFARGFYHIVIRYFAFIFLAGIIVASYEYIKQKFLTKFIPQKILSIIFDLSFYFTLLVILSNELINWTDLLGISDSYKLGLSILWGFYAIALISLGIFQKKKHLRIFAIALFAITLIKLFLYDVADLETVPKTILFVSIGILLLIASFLYNKYTKRIFEDNQ